MRSLEEFNKSFDEEDFNPFDTAYSLGQIRKRVTNLENCNDHERKYVEIAVLEERLRCVYEWRQYFAKNLRYKRPFCLNSHLFYDRPSKDGTIPEDEQMIAMGDVLSDSSDEPDSAAEELKE